jgi:hypothetical protein
VAAVYGNQPVGRDGERVKRFQFGTEVSTGIIR